MLVLSLLCAVLALQPAALAGRVPADVQEELARLHTTHSAPLLLLTSDADILDDLGRWLVRSDTPHVARRLPAMGTLSYEQQIALDRVELRCGVLVSPSWQLEPFGKESAPSSSQRLSRGNR